MPRALPAVLQVLALVALACLGATGSVVAQEFPQRLVRVIVPYPPGGGVDAIARALSERLATRWGRPVVVENRPGGATIIAAEAVARAPADGHTLLLTTEATITSNPFLFEKLPYDPQRDLAAISHLLSVPQLVVATPALAVGSIEGLVAAARDRPASIPYASYGPGSLPHLFFEALAARSGVRLIHVPYKGIAPALTSLVAGEAQLTLVGASLAAPHVRAGKLRPLAVARRTRLDDLPAVPTLAELGLADADPTESWFGLFATGGTPPATVARIQSDVAAIGNDAVFRERQVLARGFDPVFSSTESFATFIRADLARKARLIALAGVKPE